MGNKDLSGIHKPDRDGNSNIRQWRLQGKNHYTGPKKIFYIL